MCLELTGYSTSVVWTASRAATVRTRQRPETPQRKGKWRDPGYTLRQTRSTCGLTMSAWRKAPKFQNEHKQEATRLTRNGNAGGGAWAIGEAGCVMVAW